MAKRAEPESQVFMSDYLRNQRAEAYAEGVARTDFAVLSARGIEVSAVVRARISECGDLEQLEEWLCAAVEVDRAEDLFV